VTVDTSAQSTTDNIGSATQRVFAHHLGSFSEGIDSILSDYTEHSVLVTPDATYRGLQQIREFFDTFLKSASQEFWDAFKIGTQGIEGEIAYLTWSATPFVTLATDTFLVRNGKILVQTFTPFQK
jgi:hypothetical protein